LHLICFSHQIWDLKSVYSVKLLNEYRSFSHQIWDLKLKAEMGTIIHQDSFSHQIWDCYSQKFKDASIIKEMEN
ncbi:MAG TPA: hypothetical protein PLN45_04165, partial [Exilispira sp.]|nr:hypothetical protein [Exilispira sp.]